MVTTQNLFTEISSALKSILHSLNIVFYFHCTLSLSTSIAVFAVSSRSPIPFCVFFFFQFHPFSFLSSADSITYNINLLILLYSILLSFLSFCCRYSTHPQKTNILHIYSKVVTLNYFWIK